MDLEQLKSELDAKIKEMGGHAAVQRRITLQKLYFMLNFRAKREVEHVDIIGPSGFTEFMYAVDLYTETGVSRLRIPPYSCFEFKERIISDTIYRINEFAKTYLTKRPEAKVYLLYQDKGDLSEKIVRESKKQRLAEIYQVDEFLEKVERVARINDRIVSLERDWRAEREILLDSAQVSFREDKCSFFLGAGVSMDAGGPSWEALLRKIMRRFKHFGKQKDFDRIYEWCGMSPIILGRYAASNQKNLRDVSEYLRRYVLYRGVNEDDSALIKAICDAVQGPDKDKRIVAAGKVDSIITYNYDDLVETALEHRGIPVARIYEKSRNHRSEFPVYHVHGLIPKESNGIIPSPILGEKEYHQMYKEAYHWSNVEQLHALDRNTCFFIGLSMTDPNLRRLLDISRLGGDNDNRHYAFLQRRPLFRQDDVEKNRLHFNTIDLQLSDLGVHVIWYENHEEVPGMIRRIIAPMRLL